MAKRQDLPSVAKERGLAGELRLDEPLSKHTSYQIGGPADYFTAAKSQEQLRAWMTLARELEEPYLVIGRGTNLLVADRGYRGLVIENRCLDWTMNGSSFAVHAEAGVPLARLARQTAASSAGGLEWAIGIPGTLGGAVVGNAGAYDGSMADVLRRVSVLDHQGRKNELTVSELQLEYRTSRFKGARPQAEIVVSADLQLAEESPTVLRERMDRYTTQRRAAQPHEPSAGSVFKNPPGLKAAQAMDDAGLRGTRIGDAQISHHHANYIVNLGQASAEDVLQLVSLAQDTVRRLVGVELELEIELVGEWLPTHAA